MSEDWGQSDVLIMSEKLPILSDIMARPKSNSSTPSRIERRVKKAPADSVFYAAQFLDLGSRTAVDQALSRLVRTGVLRRLTRGLYYQPRRHPVLGDIAPSVEAVAKALAARDHVRLQPSGAYAANLLRLTEQVPMRVVFLTDGLARKVRFGRQTIELRQATPRMMAAAGRTTGLVIAGLRFIGKANVSEQRVAHLRKLLSPEDRRRLLKDILLAPAWMRPHLRFIAAEDKTS